MVQIWKYNVIIMFECIHLENVNTRFQILKLSLEGCRSHGNISFCPGSLCEYRWSTHLVFTPPLKVRWLYISQIKFGHFSFIAASWFRHEHKWKSQGSSQRATDSLWNGSCYLSLADVITDFELWLRIPWLNSDSHMGISVRVAIPSCFRWCIYCVKSQQFLELFRSVGKQLKKKQNISCNLQILSINTRSFKRRVMLFCCTWIPHVYLLIM